MFMYTSFNVLSYTFWCVMVFLSKLYITKKTNTLLKIAESLVVVIWVDMENHAAV